MKRNQCAEPDLLPQSTLSSAPRRHTSNLITPVLPVHHSYAKQPASRPATCRRKLKLLTEAQKGPVCELVFHSKGGGIIKKINTLQQWLSEENALQSFIGDAQSQERVIKKKPPQSGRDHGSERGRGQTRIKGKLQTFQTSLVERDEAKSGVGPTEGE